MEFGKTDDPGAIDWTLAEDTELTTHVTSRFPSLKSSTAYLGSTAWGQKGLVGAVYPAGTKPGEMLRAYGRQFNTIELNASFYRVPDRAQVLSWYASVPDDFKFCPKVHKAISQAADLSVLTSRTLDFAKSIQHFEHKLGPCFIQLPGDFTTERWDVLQQWLELWPPHLRLAVEFRHASWFTTDIGAHAFADLAAREVGSVITDVGGRRDVAHMNITAPFAVIRWVGNVHPSDDLRLDSWAKRLGKWFDGGLPEAYVFTHQPEELPSAMAAAQLRQYLLARSSPHALQVRAPTLLADPKPAAQGDLFT